MRAGLRIVWTALFALTTHPLPAAVTAPVVLYTDLASGPNSGGENDKGAYLSVFGRNFGGGGLGTRVKVLIGGVEVDNYRSLGAARGRGDIQRISVQIGAIGHPAPGVALPVQVVVAGVGSNTDQTFTVNPGRVLFVDNVHGVDATAVPGDIAHPYRHVQTASTSQAAYGAMQAGDIVVMRGTGTPWTDLGSDTYFVKFIGKTASAPSGASGTGPFTLMAYPGENVFVDVAGNVGKKGAISGVDTTSFAGGKWITIAGLRIESGGNAGVICVQIAGDHWRIVDNELTAATATNNALAAGINGNATNAFWVGNHIHDIAGGAAQENHGIYIDGDGSYEIAYNTIDHVAGGSGMQVYVNGENGSDTASNVSFHHNIVHDISKHGINIADGSMNNFRIWNNIVYNTAYANLRFITNVLHGAKIFNNTFYNAVTSGNTSYGAITSDDNLPSDALDLENNIFVPHAAMHYSGGDVPLAAGVGTIRNNLWFGGSGAHAFDTHAITTDPAFADAAQADFHLRNSGGAVEAGSASVAALVANDFDVVVARPVGTGFDIGAYEYDPTYFYDRIFADPFE
ncbi:MAG TPA: right-handed parallel beta-helix repeat-containing protein [Rudaea sp.]